MYPGLHLERKLTELAESVNVKCDCAEITATSHSADRYVYILQLRNQIVTKSFYSCGISLLVITLQ